MAQARAERERRRSEAAGREEAERQGAAVLALQRRARRWVGREAARRALRPAWDAELESLGTSARPCSACTGSPRPQLERGHGVPPERNATAADGRAAGPTPTPLQLFGLTGRLLLCLGSPGAF